MIPVIALSHALRGNALALAFSLPALSTAHAAEPVAAPPHAAQPVAALPMAAPAAGCLPTGDGYLRAKVGGALEATIDWPNSGTRCQGEKKSEPPGVRLSFERIGTGVNLLFVFGLTGISAGAPAHDTGVNLTVIVQGTSRIYGTLGDSRCTLDSLTQRPLATAGQFRVEARGFCTQPAHAVRGDGDVLVSTFEFAGPVNFSAN